MATTRWLVILKGDLRSLETLANYLTRPSATVERIGQDFYLRSTDFESMSDPGLVEQHAADVVAAANAAVSLETTAFRPTVEIVAAVRHEEGSPIPIVIVPGTAALEITGLAPTVMISGVPVDRPGDRVASRIRLGLTDDDVEQAFRLLDHPNLDWADLYKIGEVIEGSVRSIHELLGRPWIDKDKYKCFRQTANHHRHANRKKYPLPTKPMTLSHAKKYVKEVVDTWLRQEHGV